MDDGICYDVPFADYCAIEAVNNSRLGRMELSPKHYAEPFRISSPALAFGNLVHTGRIEATALAERYVVLPDWHLDPKNVTDKGERSTSKNTKYYKQKHAEFVEANTCREAVSKDDYARMQAIVKQIDADKRSRELFADPGPGEVTLVWTDPETGLKCKGRIDKVCTESGRMADLKTTGKPVTKFAKSLAEYHYHRQQAFYRYGWAALTGGELLEPWLCVVESDAPHCVASAPISEDALEQGDREWRKLLQRVAECHENGAWPGPDAPDCWELPAWAVVNEPVALKIGDATVSV